MILTFEEWKQRYTDCQVSTEVEAAMKQVHGVDVYKEIDLALQMDY